MEIKIILVGMVCRKNVRSVSIIGIGKRERR